MHPLNGAVPSLLRCLSACKFFAQRLRSVVLAISRLLFVNVAHGIQARAAVASGDPSACAHRPDHSCLVAQRLPIPLQIVLPPLLGFCILELEDNDQPFKTQLQIAWVSFGE